MEKKSQIDLFGAVSLTGFALLLAFNQVVIKVTNEGLQPVFFAGVRSAGAIACIWLWLRWRGIPLRFEPGTRGAGFLIGCVFAFEFLCLFVALDLTAVSRASVIFYSMPVWLALMAHFVLPDDRITPLKALGLGLALGGVALAILTRDDEVGSIWGDLAALGAAISWASAAMLAKASSLSRVRPEIQHFWQVAVSAPILLIAALMVAATPILLAALGELVVEKAGVLNLGVEGMMITGAICGFAVAVETGNPALGFVGGAAGGAALSLSFGILTQFLLSNQVATGLALTLFGLGISALIGQSYIGVKPPATTDLSFPILSDIPVVGPILFQHDAMVYVSLGLVIAVWYLLKYTRVGLVLRAVGENSFETSPITALAGGPGPAPGPVRVTAPRGSPSTRTVFSAPLTRASG